MKIRLERGRGPGFPEGDPRQSYEFIAPLNEDGHLDPIAWKVEREACTVRSFRPGVPERAGMLRHVGRGWRFDYVPGQTTDDEPFFKLDRHVIAPGMYVTITDEDGEQNPFKIVSVQSTATP